VVVLTNPFNEGCKVTTLDFPTTVIAPKWGSRGRGHLVAPVVARTLWKVTGRVAFYLAPAYTFDNMSTHLYVVHKHLQLSFHKSGTVVVLPTARLLVVSLWLEGLSSFDRLSWQFPFGVVGEQEWSGWFFLGWWAL